MVRRTRPSRVRRIGQPLRRLRRHNPRIIAAATLASHPGRCVLTLCVGPDETGSWRMEAVPSELWDGRHFVIEQPCPGGYCNRRALHSYHYAIVNNAARNEGGRHGMGWGYYHNEKEHRSCTECAEIMATKCYREMKVWAKSDLGSGIIAVLQGRTNADKFKAKWSPLYPLHDWAFTKLFAATVELNFDGFRISREQGRRLGLSKFDLSPEFYASPFKCRCLVGCPERLTRSMTTYKQPTEGTHSVEAIVLARKMWDRLVDLCKDRAEKITCENGTYCKATEFGAATVLQGQCSPEVMEEASVAFSTPTETKWRAAFVTHTMRTRLASFCMNPRVAAALGFDCTPCACLSSSE